VAGLRGAPLRAVNSVAGRHPFPPPAHHNTTVPGGEMTRANRADQKIVHLRIVLGGRFP
jgi:hypothetical protein